MLRQVFYDYGYARTTWAPDRSNRYKEIRASRKLWETTAVLGVGRQINGFWYPSNFEGDIE
jgi:hypothetical protein